MVLGSPMRKLRSPNKRQLKFSDETRSPMFLTMIMISSRTIVKQIIKIQGSAYISIQ